MQTERFRVPAVVALLALLPVVMFIFGRSTPIVGLSLVSVFIIALSLFYMFGPTDAAGHDDHDEDTSAGA
jgi:hypothetical protein